MKRPRKIIDPDALLARETRLVPFVRERWRLLLGYPAPYRVGMCQYVDITGLAPMLTGRQTLVSWIDTWVGPGHSDGEGWRISFDFVFYPGDDRTPDG